MCSIGRSKRVYVNSPASLHASPHARFALHNSSPPTQQFADRGCCNRVRTDDRAAQLEDGSSLLFGTLDELLDNLALVPFASHAHKQLRCVALVSCVHLTLGAVFREDLRRLCCRIDSCFSFSIFLFRYCKQFGRTTTTLC